MPAGIFISYRRQASTAQARALYERLSREFGASQVFIDLEGLEYGEDFEVSLGRQLQQCQVLLALIAPGWVEIRDPEGHRRLDDENDFVRIELRTALQRGIRVMPVLLDGAVPPRSADLPDDLKPLVRRHALEFRFNRFEADAGELVRSLRRLLDGAAPTGNAADPLQSAPPAPVPASAAGGSAPKLIVGGVLAATVAGVLWWGSKGPGPSPSSGGSTTAGRASAPTAAPAPSTASATTRVLQAQALPDGARFRDCEDDAVCPWMVVIPSGSFMMGSPSGEAGRRDSEGPQRRVTVGQRFALMETEVTRLLYESFVRETGQPVPDGCYTVNANGDEFEFRKDATWRTPRFEQTPGHPAVCVDWNDAQALAAWLSAKTRQTYRLPTEAEWEFAARGRSSSAYSFGDDASALCRYANVADKAIADRFLAFAAESSKCIDGHVFTAPVRQFGRNPFGLYDMHGNVWEWVQDCWHNSYHTASHDGSAWTTSCEEGDRAVRGGGWGSGPRYARSAIRFGAAPGSRSFDRGFRLARTLTP